MVTGILWAYLETGNSMIMSYFNLKPSHTILLCAILCTNGKASPSLLGHCDERPHVQSNLSYQDTVMRCQHVQSNLPYQTVMSDQPKPYCTIHVWQLLTKLKLKLSTLQKKVSSWIYTQHIYTPLQH